MTKIAIVRIRGGIRVSDKINDTLDMLRLYRQNYCVVYEKTPSVTGMLRKVKDYVAWGEIDDDTVKMLLEKRGEPHPDDKKKVKSFFRLSPPKGGFEKKGIKKAYKEGGALGYRGAKIKDLILRMI